MKDAQEARGGEGERNPGPELRRLRTERKLSLADLAAKVHYSKSYLSKLESGDKRLTAEVARRVDEILGTGGVLVGLVPVQEHPELDQCPYPGLAAFGSQEARWFFGRTQALADLVARLDERLDGGGPLAVVAPSGAGKSSLLAAGLVPALAGGALPGSRHWPVVITTPGAHPLTTLVDRLATETGADPATTEVAARNSDQFVAFLNRVVAEHKRPGTNSSPRIVLIIDQFEEIYTECREELARHTFMTALHTAVHSALALVVLGVRADFYGQCLASHAVSAALEGHLPLEPMNTDQLREVIIRPAQAEGLELEPGLVELLLRDLGIVDDMGSDTADYDPGALPLLAHALRVTWQQREDRMLTVAGYRRTGGIRRALASTAERAYNQLNPVEQQLAQQILLRLVNVRQEGKDTRRRLLRPRLTQMSQGPAEAVEKVLEVFGRARLLTFDVDSVAITHEALLSAWPRLADWIAADRAGLHIHQLLSEAAEAWDAENRDPFLLYRGSRLAIAQDWAARSGRRVQLSPLEEAFLKSSIDQKQREQEAERRRRTRRMRKTVGVLATLLVVALVAGGLTLHAYRTAVSQRRAAIAGTLAADSTALATQQPDAAMLLAVEGFHLQPLPQTLGALLSAQSQYFAGQLTGHRGIIYTATFSPDGHLLATAGADGTARLWDVASHRQIATLTSHTGPLGDAEFSPDSRILVTADRDGSARLWDVTSAQLIGTLAARPGVPLGAATFSHDGRVLVTTDSDGIAWLWDVTSRHAIAMLTGHTGAIFNAEFSPDDRILATAGSDGTARLWDTTSHQPIATLAGHRGRVNNVAFSPDGRIVVTAGDDTTAKLWDVATHQQIATLAGHTDVINDVAFSPDGQLLVTGSGDGTARLWDITTRQPIGTLGGHKSSIIGVAFSPDGHTVATVGEDAIIRLWVTGGPILFSSPPTINFNIAFSHDGRMLATAGNDGTARLWDTASRRQITILVHDTGAINAVAFSPDGRILATASGDGTAQLWDVAGNQLIATLTGHAGSIRNVVFSPDGHMLATTGDDGTARLWNIGTHQQIATLTVPSGIIYATTFSHNSRILVTAGADSTARLWDVASHRQIAELTGHTGTINAVALSPDDRILATGSDDGTARLWDTVHHHALGSLTDHAGFVKTVAFSHDGHTLATGSGDTTVKLWNMDTQQLIATLSGHTDVVDGVAFNPDDHLLATVGGDRTLRLWDLNPNRVTDRICHILGPVSPAQWARLIPQLPYQPTCH